MFSSSQASTPSQDVGGRILACYVAAHKEDSLGVPPMPSSVAPWYFECVVRLVIPSLHCDETVAELRRTILRKLV